MTPSHRKPPTYTDDEYIAGVHSGDEIIFTIMVRDYVEALTKFAYGFSGVEEAAHDIVQDIFARIWELRDGWQPKGTVSAYLFTSVRNRALNVIKASQADHRMRAALLAYRSQERSDVDPYNDIALAAAIEDEFGKLTPRQQEALRLRYEQEMTLPEVAEVLGIEVRPAARLIARAIDALRTGLEHIRL